MKQGDDSVNECVLVNGNVNVYSSYNGMGKGNERLRDV